MVEIKIDIQDRIAKEIEEYSGRTKIKKTKWFNNAIMAYLMHDRDLYGLQAGTLGWKQFIASKRDMVDQFDRAKEIDKSHKTSVYRGIVAESAFREWLRQFMPKKFGVTAGYIISQVEPDSIRFAHFDIIIFDQINSPIYWTEGGRELDLVGKSRAIPVEYVQAIIEVKSSLTPKASKDAIEHLAELKRYTEGIDEPLDYPKRYFPQRFCCAIVFFELGRNWGNAKVGEWLRKGGDLRGYLGGIILRPNYQTPGAILLNYIECEGKRNVLTEQMAGNGDLFESFMEDLLARLTGEPKRRYCFPVFMFPDRRQLQEDDVEAPRKR